MSQQHGKSRGDTRTSTVLGVAAILAIIAGLTGAALGVWVQSL